MMRLVCPLCRRVFFAKKKARLYAPQVAHTISRGADTSIFCRPGRRSNARTGDDSGMVAARRDFLSRGYYDRYVTESAEAMKRFLGKNTAEFLIDAACGEGHHTRILSKVSGSALTLGVDASKKAADAAVRSSRDDKSISFMRGDTSVDLLRSHHRAPMRFRFCLRRFRTRKLCAFSVREDVS